MDREVVTPGESLSEAKLRTSDGSQVTFRLGRERWPPAGGTVVFENDGSEPGEFLRCDF